MPALIFDCDGVLADTERFGHLPAFNAMFREFGLPVQWTEEEYGVLLGIGGGKERMASILTPEFISDAGLPTDPDELSSLVAQWHRRKTRIYTEMISSGAIPARPGIARVSEEAAADGWSLAVASTSAHESVVSVLEHAVGEELAARFGVYAGDAVAAKKPAPDIYNLAIDSLDVDRSDAVVVEDSRNGMLAALGAGLTCTVTTSSYTREEDFNLASLVVSSLGEPVGEGVETEVIADPFGLNPAPCVTLRHFRCLLGRARNGTNQRQEGSS